MAGSDLTLERRVPIANGADVAQTMSVLWQGASDPAMRVQPTELVRASRYSSGPATLRLSLGRSVVHAQAWGPGAEEALDAVPGLIGERDDPTALVARHAVIARLQHDLPGLRLTRGAPLMETLLVAIIGQKITAYEAHRSHGWLLRRFGERAPGPCELFLAPPAEQLARLPYFALHPLGIERRRAETIRAAAAAAHAFARLEALPAAERIGRLTAVPGIGPWTAAEAIRLSFGDPDAVSIGDYHLPRQVCHALAGEDDGNDERMLELLEPYRGQRARVVLLIEKSGLGRARHGPRMAAREIGSI